MHTPADERNDNNSNTFPFLSGRARKKQERRATVFKKKIGVYPLYSFIVVFSQAVPHYHTLTLRRRITHPSRCRMSAPMRRLNAERLRACVASAVGVKQRLRRRSSCSPASWSWRRRRPKAWSTLLRLTSTMADMARAGAVAVAADAEEARRSGGDRHHAAAAAGADPATAASPLVLLLLLVLLLRATARPAARAARRSIRAATSSIQRNQSGGSRARAKKGGGGGGGADVVMVVLPTTESESDVQGVLPRRMQHRTIAPDRVFVVFLFCAFAPPRIAVARGKRNGARASTPSSTLRPCRLPIVLHLPLPPVGPLCCSNLLSKRTPRRTVLSPLVELPAARIISQSKQRTKKN